jgi:hypothetical protein
VSPYADTFPVRRFHCERRLPLRRSYAGMFGLDWSFHGRRARVIPHKQKDAKRYTSGDPKLAESAGRLSPMCKSSHPEVPWQNIAGFRNVLVHDYLGIKLERIWEVVERDLPVLREAVAAMWRELGDQREP